LVVLDGVDLGRGRAPVAGAERLGDEQQAGVGKDRMAALENVGGGEREPPVAGGDGVAERLRRD